MPGRLHTSISIASKIVLVLTMVWIGYGWLVGQTAVVEAAYRVVTINGTSLLPDNQPESVDVIKHISFNHYEVTGALPQVVCWPVNSTITDQTVFLYESANPSVTHPLYTASWSKVIDHTAPSNISKGSFSLSIVQPGYQLKPMTAYTLRLKGGEDGIRFGCSDNQFAFIQDSELTYTFTTGADTIAPIVTNPGAGSTLNNARVYWTTAEPTTGVVRYGLTPAYGSQLSTGQGLDQAAALVNLKPGTTYYYQIISRDLSGNASDYSGSFNTWSMGAVTVSDVTGHEASISWTTSVATDSIIEYGPSEQYGLRSGGTELVTAHSVRLVHLQSKTAYYFRIKATTGDGVAVSARLTFSTRDAEAGASTVPIVFADTMVNASDEWSRFNLKDFPLDQASDSADQASQGAVLSALDTNGQSDNGLVEISKRAAGQVVTALGWTVWLWLPFLLLLAVVVASYVYYRHDITMHALHLEIKKRRQSSSQTKVS